MKLFLHVIFVIAVLLLFGCNTKSTKTIEINVTTKNVAEDQNLFISGNDSLLGNWQPDKIIFDKIDSSNWKLELEVESGKMLEFKFTKGSWESEALTDDNSIPGNHRLKVASDTILHFTITKWRDTNPILGAFNGQITGTVKYHNDFFYDGLRDRDIIVWLPPGYEKNKSKRYPVLYMHDGQNIVDPTTSSLGIDWQVDETADSLIESKEIEPLIIVGIYNTSDRSPEYSNTELGEKYVDLLINKIKPMIDKTYRTLPDRDNTGIAGSSMGGLISFIFVWNHSDVFSKAICMSPAFKYRNYDYIDVIKNGPQPDHPIKIYIDNGGLGLEQQLQPGIDKMLEHLKEIGYKNNKDLFWVIDKEAEHNEPAWALRIAYPLQLFYGKDK